MAKDTLEGIVSVAEVLGETILNQAKKTGKIINREANIKFYQVQRRNAINELGEYAYKNREISSQIVEKIKKIEDHIAILEKTEKSDDA